MQLVWYVLIFGVLYLLLQVRYDAPFWRSLGWAPPFRGASWAFVGGPVLALASATWVRDPHAGDQAACSTRCWRIVRPRFCLAIFVVILGPLCEELAFRGFLMPLLMRSAGPGSRHCADRRCCSAPCTATNTNGRGSTCC